MCGIPTFKRYSVTTARFKTLSLIGKFRFCTPFNSGKDMIVSMIGQDNFLKLSYMMQYMKIASVEMVETAWYSLPLDI